MGLGPAHEGLTSIFEGGVSDISGQHLRPQGNDGPTQPNLAEIDASIHGSLDHIQWQFPLLPMERQDPGTFCIRARRWNAVGRHGSMSMEYC